MIGIASILGSITTTSGFLNYSNLTVVSVYFQGCSSIDDVLPLGTVWPNLRYIALTDSKWPNIPKIATICPNLLILECSVQSNAPSAPSEILRPLELLPSSLKHLSITFLGLTDPNFFQYLKSFNGRLSTWRFDLRLLPFFQPLLQLPSFQSLRRIILANDSSTYLSPVTFAPLAQLPNLKVVSYVTGGRCENIRIVSSIISKMGDLFPHLEIFCLYIGLSVLPRWANPSIATLQGFKDPNLRLVLVSSSKSYWDSH